MWRGNTHGFNKFPTHADKRRGMYQRGESRIEGVHTVVKEKTQRTAAARAARLATVQVIQRLIRLRSGQRKPETHQEDRR
jgi:hypothetical protein